MDKDSEKEERWSAAQSKEDAFWQRNDVFGDQMERVVARYRPVIDKISRNLDTNSIIVDVGCGPTCAGRLFPVGVKIYVDPLMDSYVRTYKDVLPEGAKVRSTAESLPMGDHAIEVVVCVNALDHMIDPEAALTEFRRILKEGGLFVLGIFLHPPSIARARRFIESCLPFLREDAHPYSYTLKDIKALLSKYFDIEHEIRVFRKDSALVPSLHREDWMFVCKKK